jgi:hypothetical protein
LKTIFYKAKILVLIFSLVSMLFTLGGMAFAKNAGIYKPLPQLSDDAVVGAFRLPDGADGKEVFGSLIGAGGGSGRGFLLATELIMIDAVAVYFSGEDIFPLDIVWGRSFSEGDFQNHADAVIVSQETRDRCVARGGALYWDYGGDSYEVIGVYRADDSYVNPPKLFICLTARQLDPDVFRSFIFDAGGGSAEVLGSMFSQTVAGYPGLEMECIPLADAEGSEYVHYASNFEGMQGMLLLLALLILLNSMSAFSNWVTWHRKEIAVRKLCGATERQIVRWVAGKMALFIAVAGLVGIACARIFMAAAAYLPVAASARAMFGSEFSPQGLAIGLCMLVLLCGGVVALSLVRHRKKEIVEIIK